MDSSSLTLKVKIVKLMDHKDSKVDGFNLLKECLADHNDDDSLISKLEMRAVFVSLDNKVHDSGHGEKFLTYLCAHAVRVGTQAI